MKNVFTYAVKSLNAPKVNFLKKGLQMLIGADRCEVAIVAFSNSVDSSIFCQVLDSEDGLSTFPTDLGSVVVFKIVNIGKWSEKE